MKQSTSRTMKSPLVASYRDLNVYKAAFEFQQAVFTASKAFPREEMYSLTDQMRRSSRSIGACIAESWSERRYKPHFLSKLTDSDSELHETLHWLRTALACEYLSKKDSLKLANQAAEIGKMLGSMISNHLDFCTHQSASKPTDPLTH